MTWFLFLCLLTPNAQAEHGHGEHDHGQHTGIEHTETAQSDHAEHAHAKPALDAHSSAESSQNKGATVAMLADKNQAIRAGEIFSVGKEPVKIVDKLNAEIELAPYSVVEFDNSADFRLLRGSALVQSRGERSLRTSTAKVDFAGKLLVSYDHKAQSSSAFVLEGEARMINPAQEEYSLRLARLGGATLEVGGVLPQLIRQLDFSSVSSWMKGYAWPEKRRDQVLAGLPKNMESAPVAVPSHLESTKIEDYFSAIEANDDVDQPDYYETKYKDVGASSTTTQTASAAGSGSASSGPRSQSLRPEEAALITLPTTKIDLGFEIIGADEKAAELLRMNKKAPAHSAKRSLASVKPAGVKEEKSAKGGDSEVAEVLERLRGIAEPPAVVSRVPALKRDSDARAPASLGSSLVPDPVYDYSENF